MGVQQVESPFRLPDYSVASFSALGVDGTGLWSSQQGTYIRITDAAYATVAGFVAPAFRRLPVRR
ncbi:hypothetical protein D3273_26575 [Lichenibacterium minor]|uniref:Uncharacterized protein n=1 Tax=Lichenibacterium minor TaxID=2316528 RepID=A0A4Q2TZ00_9HYPH|nr:hypothetical protein [Lichenibacterium minor]RYC28950.1 hypothetical protein D3273_26575 [Lichenibacterium minor]